jgi:hypothetical protein
MQTGLAPGTLITVLASYENLINSATAGRAGGLARTHNTSGWLATIARLLFIASARSWREYRLRFHKQGKILITFM